MSLPRLLSVGLLVFFAANAVLFVVVSFATSRSRLTPDLMHAEVKHGELNAARFAYRQPLLRSTTTSPTLDDEARKAEEQLVDLEARTSQLDRSNEMMDELGRLEANAGTLAIDPNANHAALEDSERRTPRQHHKQSWEYHSGCAEGIDLVYTWVNGSDPHHLEMQRRYIPSSALAAGQTNRFRDFEEASTLRYSMRSQIAYAPWIRRVFIVVADGQRPSWLRHDAPNVTLVAHSEIFKSSRAADSLPTFNSCAIEVNLHYIPGLSECYLYLNDDFLFTRPSSPQDFWHPAAPWPFSMTNYRQVPLSRHGQDEWGTKLFHVARTLQRKTKMDRKDMLLVGHHGHFFLKTVVSEVADFFEKEFRETSASRWRSPRSLWLPFVFSHFLHWRYNATRKRVRAFYLSLTEDGGADAVAAAFESLRTKPRAWSWACFNDELRDPSQLPSIKRALRDGLDAIFPYPSPYEVIITQA